jgi:hypothetical protein
MSSFVVTPQSLEALQHAVLGLAAELDNGASATTPYAGSMIRDPSAKLGYDISGGQLNGAESFGLQTFLNNWQNSLGEIGQNIANVAKALGAAAERYAEVDDHVCLVDP